MEKHNNRLARMEKVKLDDLEGPKTSADTGIPGTETDAQTNYLVLVPPTCAEGTRVLRFHKLDFPTFNGKDAPLPWLNRCKQFFRGQRMMEGDKVWLATYHLTDIA